MPGPLSSLKVVEMVAIGPCPLAGQLLADQGAEVIVIDRASGEDMSRDINRRGKKSIALNLKDPDGVALLIDLIKQSDVLIEGFRPGVMERLGLGPKECHTANPALIYGRMTGWGQKGPLSNSAGHDLNYLAITGALNAMGRSGEPPVPPLNLVADYGGGSMFLIFGILAALFQRHQTGQGAVIDAAMTDGVTAMMGMIHTMIADGTWTKQREDNFLDGAAPYYRCYETADGKYLSVAPIEPQFFAEFVRLAELDAQLLTQQFDKSKWPEMTLLFEKHFKTRTRDEWTGIFEGSDACVAPVLDFDEAPAYPHNRERKLFRQENGVVQAAPAPRFTGADAPQTTPAGLTGQDGNEILKSLGLNDDAITQLRKRKVLL